MRWITAPEPGTAAAGGWRGVGVLGVPGVLGAARWLRDMPCTSWCTFPRK